MAWGARGAGSEQLATNWWVPTLGDQHVEKHPSDKNMKPRDGVSFGEGKKCRQFKWLPISDERRSTSRALSNGYVMCVGPRRHVPMMRTVPAGIRLRHQDGVYRVSVRTVHNFKIFQVFVWTACGLG